MAWLDAHVQAWSGGVMALLALCSVGYGVVVLDMRRRFPGRADYAALRGAHHDLAQDVEQLKTRVADLPTHKEFSALGQQLAVLGANVDAVREATGRVEHMTDLLVRDRMREGDDQ